MAILKISRHKPCLVYFLRWQQSFFCLQEGPKMLSASTACTKTLPTLSLFGNCLLSIRPPQMVRFILSKDQTKWHRIFGHPVQLCIKRVSGPLFDTAQPSSICLPVVIVTRVTRWSDWRQRMSAAPAERVTRRLCQSSPTDAVDRMS